MSVRGPRPRDSFLNRLRMLNVERVHLFGHTLGEWNALEWAAAACGECGEVANVAKKMKRVEDGCNVNTAGKSREELALDLADEIADTLIYLDLLAAREGIDLAEAVARKFDRVSDRVGFTMRLMPPVVAPRVWDEEALESKSTAGAAVAPEGGEALSEDGRDARPTGEVA